MSKILVVTPWQMDISWAVYCILMIRLSHVQNFGGHVGEHDHLMGLYLGPNFWWARLGTLALTTPTIQQNNMRPGFTETSCISAENLQFCC
jgi:hypothetical protein